MVDTFFKTHEYLLEHVNVPLRRRLMDEINWEDRLIGIKGSRGIGKTTFLLQYAKENFDPKDRSCLYINLNQLYFTCHSLSDFVGDFRKQGGKILLLDQVFKYPDWAEDLSYCYDNYPDIKIVFTCSTVIPLGRDNKNLYGKVSAYKLRGFSLREYICLKTGEKLKTYSLNDILQNHRIISREIESKVHPMDFFEDYNHHGFYPFLLEKHDYSENLLKTTNMTLEIDLLSIKQIEHNYLSKIRKLLYLLSLSAPGSPNVSQLSQDIKTSRATVMNYIKYLSDARLINTLYERGEEFPKKPAKIYMQNPNLLYMINPEDTDFQALEETFFYAQLHTDGIDIHLGEKNAQFLVNDKFNFIINKNYKKKNRPDTYYVIKDDISDDYRQIPIWLTGFLY